MGRVWKWVYGYGSTRECSDLVGSFDAMRCLWYGVGGWVDKRRGEAFATSAGWKPMEELGRLGNWASISQHVTDMQ